MRQNNIRVGYCTYVICRNLVKAKGTWHGTGNENAKIIFFRASSAKFDRFTSNEDQNETKMIISPFYTYLVYISPAKVLRFCDNL